MELFKYRTEDDMLLPSEIGIRLHPGVLRILTDGTATLETAMGARDVTACWILEAHNARLTFTGHTSLTLERLALTDLDVNELLAVVDFHDVATNAGTEAGLIRAIERELGL